MKPNIVFCDLHENAEETIAALEARLKEAEAIIRDNQYNGLSDGFSACPECGATMIDTHTKACRIPAFLAGGEK